MYVFKYRKGLHYLKSLILLLLIPMLLLGCSQTNITEQKPNLDNTAENEVKPDSINDDFSENTKDFITKDFIMAVENIHAKVSLETVDVQINDSTKGNLKTILSSIDLVNKSDEEVFIYLKYSCSDDVMKFKIPANWTENMKVHTQVSNDVNIEDISLSVKVESKDNKVIFNHSFGLISEISK